MPATITLKLKPYLQEFLKCCFKTEELSAKNNLIGKFLKPLLQYRPIDCPPVFNKGTNYITITIPRLMNLDERFGTVYVSEENQEVFESQLQAYFWNLFYNFMDDKVRYLKKENTTKGTIKKCILQFCADYDISYNHITYEMMKKAYYRRRMNGRKVHKTSPHSLSLSCPLFFLL